MRLHPARVAVILCALLAGTALQAQQPPVSAATPFPRLVRVTSTFVPANHLPPAPLETVTLAIFGEETGGTPLWQETQQVAVDTEGRYTLLLGATVLDGLPLELFAFGEARWLARRFERPGEPEPARVLLASVPYALKAADADTLGGRPSSAYLLDPDASAGTGAAGTRAAGKTGTISASDVPALTDGTANFLGKFVNGTDLGNSSLYDAGGFVGLNTTTPFDALHVRFTNINGAFTGYAVQNLGNTATSYSGMLFYDQNGALGQFQGFNNLTHEYRINDVALGGSIDLMLGGASKLKVRADGNVDVTGSLHAGQFGQIGGGSVYGVLGQGAYGVQGQGTSFGVLGQGPTAGVMGIGFTGLSGEGRDIGVYGVGLAPSAIGVFGRGNDWGGWFESDVYVGRKIGIGTTTPTAGLHVEHDVADSIYAHNTTGVAIRARSEQNFAGLFDGFVDFKNLVFLEALGSAGSQSLCRNASNHVATCSSSLRYKTNVKPFAEGLTIVRHLKPVVFDWKESGAHDLGLVAEDVEHVAPLLTFRNDNGEVEGVKYDRLGVVLINAVQEQQAQIDAQQEQLAAQQAALDAQQQQIAALQRLLCADATRATACVGTN